MALGTRERAGEYVSQSADRGLELTRNCSGLGRGVDNRWPPA